MKENNPIPIRFTSEQLKLIEKAIIHYNKFVRLGSTNRTKLIQEGSIALAKEILSSKKIIISFNKK